MKQIFNRILAALIFFTRLPFWRIAEVPKECYERVVPLWPLVGWLTGGIMAATFWVASMFMPMGIAVMLALTMRVLATGALHEDGFADFCDGFGGGTSRQRTLEIMKDSHIGTYGVLGLILYYIIMYNALCTLLSIYATPLILIVVDAMAKYVSSTIIYFLPYARNEAEAKNKLVYQHVRPAEKLSSALLGFAPAIAVIAISQGAFAAPILIAAMVAVITATYLFRKMHTRIQGYTGDCCGASFIIIEAMMCIALCI